MYLVTAVKTIDLREVGTQDKLIVAQVLVDTVEQVAGVINDLHEHLISTHDRERVRWEWVPVEYGDRFLVAQTQEQYLRDH